jgi:L-ascorbate metabolism protein UlaG (beta-lactamase superfamily)
VARRLRRRFYPLIAVAAIAASAYVVGRRLGAPRWQGPPSDHFDGHEFHNLAPFEDKGLWDVLAWKVRGRGVAWPDWRDVPAHPAPAARVDGLRVTFVNHATCLVQLAGVNVVTDPVWSDRVGPASWLGPKRHKPPGLAWGELPRIDAIVISHDHYDHLDLPTLARLVERDHPVILAGLGTRALLDRHGLGDRAVDLDWWQSHDVRGVRITFAPAQHWSSRGLGDRRGVLWGSFFLSAGGRSVYFAGDTGDGPHFRLVRERLGTPTLALLPIGAYEPRWFMRSQHIDPTEAVAAHVALGARRSLGIHWGTFDETDESIDDPPNGLIAARRRAGLADGAFVAVDNGGILEAP